MNTWPVQAHGRGKALTPMFPRLVGSSGDDDEYTRIGRLYVALQRAMGNITGVQTFSNISGEELIPFRAELMTNGRGWKTQLDAYVTAFQAGERSDCYLAQVRTLVRDLMEFAGADDLRALTAESVQKFIDHCKTHGRERRNERNLRLGGMRKAGQKTRNTYVSMIRALLQWCIDGEHYNFRRSDTNVSDTIRTPRTPKPKGRAWKLPEAIALNDIPIESDEDWKRWVLYRFLSISGMRVGAACKLPGGFLVLQDDRPRVEIPEHCSKTKQQYTSALDPLTAKLLRILRAATPDYAPSVPILKKPHADKLIADCERVGIAIRDERGRRVGFNCFRRFVPTQLDKLRINAAVAQAQLGHADISTTLTYYTDAGLEDQSNAASALANAICATTTGIEKEKTRKPVDNEASTRHTESAMFPNHKISSERVFGQAGDIAETGNGRPFARDFACPAPVGTGEAVVGAAGLEPVAPLRDLPPRLYDVMSRLLAIAEDAARSRHAPARQGGAA